MMAQRMPQTRLLATGEAGRGAAAVVAAAAAAARTGRGVAAALGLGEVA